MAKFRLTNKKVWSTFSKVAGVDSVHKRLPLSLCFKQKSLDFFALEQIGVSLKNAKATRRGIHR